MIQHNHVRSTLNPVVALGFVLGLFLCLLLAGCGGGGSGGPPPPPPPAAPAITLTPPAGGSASLNRTVNLSANVTAPAGVTRVEFLVDGTVVGTSTTSPYTFAWDTSVVTDGTHSLAARVTDAANNVVTSVAVNASVNNAPAINVVLSPDELFPRPGSTASGSATLTFNLTSGAVTGNATLVGNFPDATTLVTINQGYAGTVGPVVVNFVRNAAAGRWDAAPGSILSSGQLDELLRGQLYLKVASAAFPTAELRGQVQAENIDVAFTAMNGNAVVPPSPVNATGLAATTLDSLAGSLIVHVNTLGVDDATRAHVRKAAAGANSATDLVALTQPPGVVRHWSAEIWSTERRASTPEERADFTNGAWYVEVVAPAGAIRGQITPNAPLPPPAVTLTQLQNAIFGPVCSGCHSGGGATLPGSMNLSSAAASFAALVNRASVQQAAVLRVAPGIPNDSYLVHKLEGRPGINGVRMPQGGQLTPAQIDQVKAWITAGAQNN